MLKQATFITPSPLQPSLLSAMGYSSIQSQLMTVPPYAVGTVVCICLAMTSDRFKMRGPIIFAIVGPLIFIAFVILRTVDNVGIRYMAIFFATSGAFTGSPVIVAWTVDNTAGPMVRAIASAYSVSLGCLGKSFIIYVKEKKTYVYVDTNTFPTQVEFLQPGLMFHRKPLVMPLATQ
jgi:hypothetical protein